MARGLPHALRSNAAAAAALSGPLSWREEGRGTVSVEPGMLGDAVLARKGRGHELPPGRDGR